MLKIITKASTKLSYINLWHIDCVMPRQDAISVKRCQMKKILVFVAILALNAHLTMAAAPVDERVKKCSMGHEFLKQHKYQEARTALEVCLQKGPANAMAHFYLGDACQGLKAWACAESHYETSLELDAHSSVASLV